MTPTTVLLVFATCVVSGALTLPASDVTTDVIASAIGVFGQKMYQHLAANSTELVYSPLSIHSVMSMTSLGAKGRTSGEMTYTLGVDGIQGGPHQGYHYLLQKLNTATEADLYTGNGVFVNPHYRIESSFVQSAQDLYSAKAGEFEPMAAQGPERAINDWVVNTTHGMIKDILPMYSITPNTAMVLINTLYFNATWETPFKTFLTKPKTFQQLGGTTSQVEMMTDSRSMQYKSSASLQTHVVQIPVKGGRFSLYVLVPHQADGLSQLETQLSSLPSSDSLYTGLQDTYVHLEIPKFKVKSVFELKDTLKAMGMVAAFDENLSDFTGLVKNPNAYISSVRHQAVLEVQESGITASAATAVTIVSRGELVMAKPVDVIADHPFLFVLRDDVTGAVLFQGKYSG